MLSCSLAALFLVASFLPEEVQSLSCVPCGLHPCQDPVCCDSGYFTTDACGCCAQCAKGKDQSCGGPFSTENCAKGLRCLRSCNCFTEKGNDCIFPFEYLGKVYTQCTTDHSQNRKPWCAIKVHSNNTVIEDQWEDCSGPCNCDERDLFNMQGRCVEQDKADSLVQIFKSRNSVAKIDEDFGLQQNVISECPRVKTPSDSLDFCKCTKKSLYRDLQGNLKGGCLPPTSAGTGGLPESSGYCFLENVRDPSDPASSCFDDTEWSQADGQFYSHQACQNNE